jgi:hypothetical protein
MVKEELEKWDEPVSVTPSGAGNYASRAASPSSYSPTEFNVGKKSAWRQQ